MNLYLMRHSETLSKAQAMVSTDADRPLSKEGIATAKRMARIIKELLRDGILILSSPLLRAKQTSELISNEIGNEDKVEILNLLDPVNAPADFIEELFSRNIKKDVLAVGHYPYLGNVASSLAGEESMPKDFILEPCGFFMIELSDYPYSRNGKLCILADPGSPGIITRL